MLTCRDCIHYDVCYKIEHFGRDLETDGACEEFSGNNKWVSVADRLPDSQLNCLVFYESVDKRIGYGCYNSDCDCWLICNIFSGHFAFFDQGSVLYWMPLPEPPEKEFEEEYQ